MSQASVPTRILLIGPSGAGKSTVGPLLAAALGLPFHDTDAAIECAAGRPLARIFALEGESSFRRRESAALRELLALPPAVVAVGAGALLDPAAAPLLRAHGRIVLLDAQPATLAARLGGAADRPLLTGATDLHARLDSQRLTRDPLYRALADLVLVTDGLALTTVAAAIVAALDAGRAGVPR